MIVFVTKYDAPTTANFRALAPWLPEDAIVGENALRSTLRRTLRQNPAACLGIWSHGTHEGAREHGGGTALGMDDVATIAARPAYAYACHTGTGFGLVAAGCDWEWWGYTGAITAPGDGEKELAVVGRAFWKTFELFLRARGAEELPNALMAVKAVANEASAALDEMEAGVDSYLALFHLWDRLRVWLPGTETPVAPAGISSPILLPDDDRRANAG